MVAAIAAICFAAFRPIPVDTLSITQADKEVYVGYPSSPVKVAYTPTDARQTEITWSSSDESVATVDSDGIVNRDDNRRSRKRGHGDLRNAVLRHPELQADCQR